VDCFQKVADFAQIEVGKIFNQSREEVKKGGKQSVRSEILQQREHVQFKLNVKIPPPP
jgi:hypothetical protein